MEPQPVDAWTRGSSAAQLGADIAPPGVTSVAGPGSDEEGTANDRLRAAIFLAQQSRDEVEALQNTQRQQQQRQQRRGTWQDPWHMVEWGRRQEPRRMRGDLPSTVSTASQPFGTSDTRALPYPAPPGMIASPPQHLLVPSGAADVGGGGEHPPEIAASGGGSIDARRQEAVVQQLMPQLQELQDVAARYADRRRRSAAAPARQSRCLSWNSLFLSFSLQDSRSDLTSSINSVSLRKLCK